MRALVKLSPALLALTTTALATGCRVGTGGDGTTPTVSPLGADDGGLILLPDGALAEPPDGGPVEIVDDGGGNGYTPITIYVPGVTVRTLAGSSAVGEVDGVGSAAQFNNPTGIALDHDGNLLVVDYDGWTVRRVTPAGQVTTIAKAINFSRPFAAAVGDDGTYYVSTDDDPNNNGIKTPTSGTVWSVPKGTGVAAPVPIAQTMWRPRGITAATGGGLFTVSRYHNVVGYLDVTTGNYAHWAGGNSGYADGQGTSAEFRSPLGAARLPDGTYAVADGDSATIRRVTSGGVVSTIAGVGVPGMIDGACNVARFGTPRDVAVDAAGNIYVADGLNEHIRRIRMSPNCTVETLAGTGATGYADGPGDAAIFYGMEGLDVTPDGTTVYVADGDLGTGDAFHRIRVLSVPRL